METDAEFAVRMLDLAERTGDVGMKSIAIRAVSSLAPTEPIGVQVPGYAASRQKLGGLDLGWGAFIDRHEYVPELKWPQSVRINDMMSTDSQLSGLMRAMTYPIRRFKFMIKENGARPEIVQGIADDMNLDIVGREPRPRGRRKHRFSFEDYRYHALLALRYGHMPFEQYGEIKTISEGGDGLWHLKKLDPRMPQTIFRINIAEDGGLISIQQNINKLTGSSILGLGGIGAAPPIPVENLVWFAWEKEGPNWVGKSMQRDCYRNWLIKDRLMRVDAINHERAGGIHVAKAPQGASPAEIERLSQMAQRAIVAEGGGGAIPHGAEYDIKKIGSGTDVIASIRYHDESMARLFLHMFIQLGQTETGSRALGQSFIEYAFIAQKAVASWFVDVTNEHVIEDWVDWNYGEDEPAPLLTYIIEEEDEHLAVEELVKLITAGAIIVDAELEDSLREHYKLPARTGTRPDPATTVQIPAAASAFDVEQIRLYVQDAVFRLSDQMERHRLESGKSMKEFRADFTGKSNGILAAIMRRGERNKYASLPK